MDNSTILKSFNEHFIDFVSDIQQVFPEDPTILTLKNSLIGIRKANPKLIIKIWKEYINVNYKSEIMMGDISFFIEKDYNTDLSQMDTSSSIISKIDALRDPIKNMGLENQQKCIKYIKFNKIIGIIYLILSAFIFIFKYDLKNHYIIYYIMNENNNTQQKDFKNDFKK